ncbi:MAG: rhodanese-like domain-containing protein [Candidatus Azosocius agrarius]|nr:MAG: rhodanese-like domain-containing protein [Gammaproteobacteria bacterium]
MYYFFNFLFYHWILSLSFIIILILLIIFELMYFYNRNTISSLELVNLMNRKTILIVDCRKRENYLNGHILGSNNLCTDDDLFLKKYLKKTVILVCENGKNSAKKVSLFKKKGYSDVRNLEGGIESWIKEGYPTI